MASETTPKSGRMVSLVGIEESEGDEITVEVGDTFPDEVELDALILITNNGPRFPKGSTVKVIRDHLAVIVRQD